jgi:hypothetical protein
MATTNDEAELNPIARAVAKLGWGGQSKLARKLTELGKPCTPQAVQKWCATGHVPPDRIDDVERILGERLRVDTPSDSSTESAAA